MEEVYGLWSFLPEMRNAMERWERHIGQIV